MIKLSFLRNLVTSYSWYTWVGSVHLVTACSECSKNDPYCKNLITEIIFDELNYEATMKVGVF